MNVKRLTGSEGRRALYALAAVTGEVVLALGGVMVIKDPAAFAASARRLSWKRIPTQILIDGGTVDSDTLEQIAAQLSSVAPVIVATSNPTQEVLE